MFSFLKFSKKNEPKSQEELREKIEDLIEGAVNEEHTEENSLKLDRSEISLVSNVLHLRDLTVGDIMIPRAEIVAAKSSTTLKEFVDIFSKSGFSQIPVYSNTLDNVIGVVRIRDFLPYVLDPSSFSLQSILRDVVFIVSSMQLLELLVEMKLSGKHMALVVDEFGGVDGLVTLEDVISEIVGEIQQNQILPQFVHRYDGSFLVDAKFLASECSQKLGIDLIKPLIAEGDDAPEVDTIGGLLAYMLGRLPSKGEIIHHPSNIDFEIIEADPRRIKRIVIRYRDEEVDKGEL